MILPPVHIKKILYGTDLSENARYAFAYAVSLANAYQAGITILHVLADDANIEACAALYIGREAWHQIRQRTYDRARQALIGKKRADIAIEEVLQKFSETTRAADAGQASVTDEIIVKQGVPEEHILAQAIQRQADLIVIGSHGHGAIAEALMGSTARRVLRRSTIPVVVVPVGQLQAAAEKSRNPKVRPTPADVRRSTPGGPGSPLAETDALRHKLELYF